VVIPKEGTFILPAKVIAFQINKCPGRKSRHFEISDMELISAQIDGTKYLMPKHVNQCRDAPIPCTPYKIHGVKFDALVKNKDFPQRRKERKDNISKLKVFSLRPLRLCGYKKTFLDFLLVHQI